MIYLFLLQYFILLKIFSKTLANPMYLKFKSLTGKDKAIEMESSATISELKNKISELELIPFEQLRLVCNGKVLGNNLETLSSYKIVSGNMVHVVLALRGG